jgi:hypothetical protein
MSGWIALGPGLMSFCSGIRGLPYRVAGVIEMVLSPFEV